MRALIAALLVLAGDPELRVSKEGWGGASPADVAAVLRSAARAFSSAIPDLRLPPIEVSRGHGSPITLYRRGPGGEYLVRLDVEGNLWARFAYQFAHEFAHVLAGCHEYANPNMWFEESLCEAASLYALGRMAEEWKTAPPYPNWKDYSAALASYRKDRMTFALPDGDSPAAWLRREEASLRKNATERDKNAVAAAVLLPIFEKTPAAWGALRSLNAVRNRPDRSFADYLADWERNLPGEHRGVVAEIGRAFGVRP
jgi:hypothetical protein